MSLAATTSALIANWGELGAIRRLEVADDGPVHLHPSMDTVTDHPAFIVPLPVRQDDVADATIKAGEFTVLMAGDAVGFEVTTTDKVVCSFGTLTILDAGAFRLRGSVLHYKMRARL